MTDHMAIAKDFLEEQLAKRDDIIAAYVYGSVARGDATEYSDIDMAFDAGIRPAAAESGRFG